MTTRFYEYSVNGHLLPQIVPFNAAFKPLLGQAESMNDVIDRAIESLGKSEAEVIEIEASVKDGAVTLAAGFKFKNDWTIVIMGERAKDGALAGQFKVRIPV